MNLKPGIPPGSGFLFLFYFKNLLNFPPWRSTHTLWNVLHPISFLKNPFQVAFEDFLVSSGKFSLSYSTLPLFGT